MKPNHKPNPNQNITRIEAQTAGKIKVKRKPIKGWEVRIYRRGERFNKFFSDSVHGGKNKALELARKERDKVEKKMKKFTRKELAEKVTARNTSGHRGIRLRNTNIKVGDKVYSYDHVEASWSPEPGKVIKKSFSVAKLGKDEAWKMAIAARKEAVANIKN